MLTEFGKKVFFPSGKNDWGQLSEMEVHLSTCNGDVIEQFVDHDGKNVHYKNIWKVLSLIHHSFMCI